MEHVMIVSGLRSLIRESFFKLVMRADVMPPCRDHAWDTKAYIQAHGAYEVRSTTTYIIHDVGPSPVERCTTNTAYN
jgi:hypothetical protein